MKCNNCGGEMELKKDEDVLIPVGDDEEPTHKDTSKSGGKE